MNDEFGLNEKGGFRMLVKVKSMLPFIAKVALCLVAILLISSIVFVATYKHTYLITVLDKYRVYDTSERDVSMPLNHSNQDFPYYEIVYAIDMEYGGPGDRRGVATTLIYKTTATDITKDPEWYPDYGTFTGLQYDDCYKVTTSGYYIPILSMYEEIISYERVKAL